MQSTLQPKTSSDEISFVYERLYRSPRYYSELLLKIKTKEAQIKPLIYNRSQKYLYSMVQKMRIEGRPVRIVCVKARQLGVTTVVSSIIHHHSSTRSNVTSMVSSHDLDSSENIHRMYKLFHDMTDECFKPMSKYSNRKELLFENPDEATRKKSPGLNSRIMVETSNNTSLGRSFTVQNFHGSEVAFWNDPEKVMMGVEEAVPNLPGTSIFLESTANGIGNYFHKKCEQAFRKKSDYRLVFIPWFWDEGYMVEARDVKIDRLCNHDKAEFGNEKYLYRELGVTKRQLQWRRNKIETSYEGNIDSFAQEYPSTWQEAFIFSGQPLFNTKILLGMKEECRAPKIRGHITWDGVEEYNITPSPQGELSVWETPQQNEIYTIGVDVAEGIEGADNSCVEILHVRTMTQVAEWCGIIEADELAHVVFHLASWFWNPLVGVEINNHGLTTVVALRNMHYWNQYRRIAFDKTTKKRREQLGWKTTMVTKPLIVDGLRQLVREGEIILNSKACVDEMMKFVKHDDGSMGAAPGVHDDRVMALAIAVEMAKQSTVRSRVRPKLQLVKPLTFGDVDRMADEMNAEAERIPPIGVYK